MISRVRTRSAGRLAAAKSVMPSHGVGQPDRSRLAAEALVDRDHAAHDALEHGAVHRVLAGKVVEQHALADAGALRDLAGGGRAVAALGEQRLGGVEDAPADVASRARECRRADRE